MDPLPSHPHSCPPALCRPPQACLQVREGLQALQGRREQVFQAWGQKQERLQAMHQEQLFLRKCGHLEEILRVQEAGAPSSRPLPDSLPSWGPGTSPAVERGGCILPLHRQRHGGVMGGCADRP